MKNIMLIYPPGTAVQRGEDRCQINLDAAVAQGIRACNDLGYAAAVLKNHNVFLKDYQSEHLTVQDLVDDIKDFKPAVVVISTTNTTIFDDLEIVKAIKPHSAGARIVLKGAIFYDPEQQMLDLLDLSDIDVIIGGEIDFAIEKVVEGDYSVDNILYKDENGVFQKTRFGVWGEDLDSRPFPARHLMKNELYVRPDTGEAMATIQSARGCPASCIFCLSPQISGRKIRLRSAQSVVDEIKECLNVHGIKNFFFRADTFTMDAGWVKELCDLIVAEDLKISFITNARVKPLKKETLVAMKKAGCWAVAFGFESGSEESLKKMKKGASVQDNINAAKWAREAGLTVFGMFVIGFPWETKEDIKKTEKLIFKINPDFIELTLALPFYGTELYRICKEKGLLGESVLGSDFFYANVTKTEHFDTQELLKIRKNILLKFYTRPQYIAKKVFGALNSPKTITNYFKYGLRLLKILR